MTILEQLQSATEGSRELDDLVAQAQDYSTLRGEMCVKGTWVDIPDYTTSLDAKLPWENIVGTSVTPTGWVATHAEEDGDGTVFYHEGHAKTEILARRIAAFKARNTIP